MIAIKHRATNLTYTTAHTVVAADVALIVSGGIEKVERFDDLTRGHHGPGGPMRRTLWILDYRDTGRQGDSFVSDVVVTLPRLITIT
ncbi:hypothetical protein GCM10023318_34300 [Nocardia callitridis]|uniref:Uncharacterized protein n=1 Tax=Nocardia callitridis TaxID=648753 RepID=A0ABP9KGP5_9NOCA